MPRPGAGARARPPSWGSSRPLSRESSSTPRATIERMPVTHLLLALAVVFVWGTNFVVIKWGLAQFPPFLFAALRFLLCVVPCIFFIPKPHVSWGKLAAFGVLLGAGQFGLLFLAMQHDVPPCLASMMIQTQVFFTIGLAMTIEGERIRVPQVAAMSLAVGGIALIAWHAVSEG